MSGASDTGGRQMAALRRSLALVLAILVFLGLASSGLAPPERADVRPLIPQEAQQAGASARGPSVPTAEARARRAIVATRSPNADGAVAPLSTRPDLAHQDADVRRGRLRLGIAIRGPPAWRLA